MSRRHTPLDTPFFAGAAIAFFAAIAWKPQSALALEPGYQIQVGIAESDNIQRLPSGGSDETIGFEELGFIWHDKRPWFDVDIDADLSHLNYLQNTYPSEFAGNFIGDAQIHIVPQLFSWNIADNFGQAALNPLAPANPGNRENINYLDTGPVLSVPLGSETRFDAIGQYGRVDYQRSPLNSTRLAAGIALVHQLSQLSSVSINAHDEHVDYEDDQLNPDYQKQEAFVRYETSGSRTLLGLDLGYGRLQMTGANEDGWLARLELTHRVSAASTVEVLFGHDFSDGADSFRLVQALGGAALNTQTTVQAGDPFVSNYATLGWKFAEARTTLNLSVSYFQDRYITDIALNNERTVVAAGASRRLSPVLDLALTEYLTRQQFDDGGGETTQSDTGLQLTWRAGRNLSVFVAYYLAKANSDVPANIYTENRLWLSIGYGRAAEVAPGPAPLRLPTNL